MEGQTLSIPGTENLPYTKPRRVELEEQIDFNYSEISKNKKEIKKINQKIKDRLLADNAYSMANDDIKEAQKERSKAKKEAIKKDDILSQLHDTLKTLRADNRMRQLSLSDYLLEFEELTGSRTVTDSQGELFDFEVYAKLKPKSK